IAIARLTAGDPAAGADWAAQLLQPMEPWSFRFERLAPLWMFPNDPALRQAAELLFTQPGSRFAPPLDTELVHSSLLTVPAFRQAITAALENSAVIGSATRTEDGRLSFTYAGSFGSTSGGSGKETDPRQVAPGEKRAIRVKDVIAD